MHVGLFGYGRSLGGVGGVTLPRAIGFAASLYSIGVPPELLGLACLTESDLEFIREVYPNMDGNLRAALRFTNERHVRELLGDSYMSVVGQYTDELDRVHEGLTSAIWASVGNEDVTTHRSQFVEEATHLRHLYERPSNMAFGGTRVSTAAVSCTVEQYGTPPSANVAPDG